MATFFQICFFNIENFRKKIYEEIQVIVLIYGTNCKYWTMFRSNLTMPP